MTQAQTVDTVETVAIRQQRGIGYRGKLGQDAWLARITGTDADMGLRREFLRADHVERDVWNRPRYVETLTYHLTPGLYQEQSQGDRRMIMVYTRQGKAVWTSQITQDRLDAMLALMDAGQDFETARIATRPARVS
jgi:hypothetical protein